MIMQKNFLSGRRTKQSSQKMETISREERTDEGKFVNNYQSAAVMITPAHRGTAPLLRTQIAMALPITC